MLASANAISIPYITATWIDGQQYSWSSNWGQQCGLDCNYSGKYFGNYLHHLIFQLTRN
ncbi:hypothetical protein J3F84DRAFT_390780 [Trichoderma pleuroticola]